MEKKTKTLEKDNEARNVAIEEKRGPQKSKVREEKKAEGKNNRRTQRNLG